MTDKDQRDLTKIEFIEAIVAVSLVFAVLAPLLVYLMEQ